MGKTVLVIEDDGPIAEMLGLLLGDEGYTVAVAGTGPEGVERAGAVHPDLITLDLALPGADGAAVLRALRQIVGLTPVVVISAHPDQLASADRALAADVLAKPFDIDDLLACVERHLK